MSSALGTISARASELLGIDPEVESARIANVLQRSVGEVLKRRGLVVGMSGGIDSSVCVALAVKALGPSHVFGLMMPEQESNPESLALATEWADRLGIEYTVEPVTSLLIAAGCYARRDEAIRRVVPCYGSDWRCKLVLGEDRREIGRLNVFSVVVQRPDGSMETHRLPPAEYRQIVAATNFKQRVRAMMEYYHADRLHYAVVGTPNRLEYDQGFFVKGGDGLADVKPIAHLYKTQVSRVAEYLGVPEEIRRRLPTTDTYSLEQSQEEFFFTLSAGDMDAMLYAHNAGMSEAEAARLLGFRPEQVTSAYRDIERKRSTTRYLHQWPLLTEPVPQVAVAAPDDTLAERRT